MIRLKTVQAGKTSLDRRVKALCLETESLLAASKELRSRSEVLIAASSRICSISRRLAGCAENGVQSGSSDHVQLGGSRKSSNSHSRRGNNFFLAKPLADRPTLR